MSTRPEFHLRRVDSDGAEGDLEVRTWSDVPLDVNASRRGFVGAGLTVGALLHALGQPRQGDAANAKDADAVQAARVVSAHKDAVEDLKFTPDGQSLVSCSVDRTIKIWSLSDGKRKQTLTGHTDSVNALAIVPAGDLLASASRDKMIRLWSMPSGRFIRSFQAQSMIDAMTVTPDGKTLITGSWDKPIRLWSLPGGKLEKNLFPKQGYVHALALSPDGKLLASGGSDKKVTLWSLADGKIQHSLEGHTGKVGSLCFSADGRQLASGSWDKTIRIWNVADGSARETLAGHTAGVDALAASRSSWFASGSWDQQIKLWAWADGTQGHTLTGHQDKVQCVTISPDGSTMASGDRQGVILLWNVLSGTCLGFLFDPEASENDAYVYTVKDAATGRVLTYTLPCGAPTPAGATCVCNCVPGTYRPPTVAARAAPPKREPRPIPPPRNRNPVPDTFNQPPVFIPPYRPPTYFGGNAMGGNSRGGNAGSMGGGTFCTCNKICTCIPVCQAHRLLHPDLVVRQLAEQLLLLMGRAEFRYMAWAARRATGLLRSRVLEIVTRIRAGAGFDPRQSPSLADCVARLDDPDEVVAIMAAQMIDHRWGTARMEAGHRAAVAERLRSAARCPWYVRYQEPRPR